ncbi:AraC-type DNA-binding protein [Bradyrhizobium brasilense]|uniref:AraC-type DNA-binding protein n=1 Tax=Bradyrhizobium brasilense TaxID=1419277 RepID=A0A1G6RTW5_9BRAD|nr:AraC family transcriptional regulator [Bradyrhizobium brasilense]SDD07873.1 AraC-type DNA-binding protein [Bradyrhizobium brasilense]
METGGTNPGSDLEGRDDELRLNPPLIGADQDVTVVRASKGSTWSDLFVVLTEERPHGVTYGAFPGLWISMPLTQARIHRISSGNDLQVEMEPYAISLMAPQTPFEVEVGESVRAVHVCLRESLLQEVAEEFYDHDAQDIGIISAFGENDPGLSYLLRAAEQTLLAPVPAARLKTDHLARALSADVLSKYAEIVPGRLKPRSPERLSTAQLQRVTEYIREHLGMNIALNELAAVAGLSRTSFIRRFKASLHQTPDRFLWRTRIRRAQELLVNSQLPITQIAIACGFASQAHLSIAFKRETGVTPSMFRRDRS